MVATNRRGLLVLLATLIAVSPLMLSVAFTTPVKAVASSVSWTDGANGSPEDMLGNPNYYQVASSLTTLGAVLSTRDKLVISPQDMNYIKDGKVDVRTTDYLIYLVTPVELGGAGFDHIKAGRLLKNYDSEGVGKYDRETLAAVEEDQSFVSTHNRGTAVDVTQVGSITCKLIEKRHVGGNTTKWQAPRNIEVAWQSTAGIARHPTPKGPSLVEIAGGLTAQGWLRLLNDSGQLDEVADFVKGLDFNSIVAYVGANILIKHYGAGDVTSDPLANGLIATIGASVLQKSIPDLPAGFGIASRDDDIRVAMVKARLEETLNLPPGSLRGWGWNELLKSTGKRNLEGALSLPALFLESHDLAQLNSSAKNNGAVKMLKRNDDAFNVPRGSLEKIRANDEDGLKLAGVNILADALRLTDVQKSELLKIAQNKPGHVDLTAVPLDDKITPTDLQLLFSPKDSDHQEVAGKFKQLGLQMLQEAIKKATPNQYLGVTTDLLNKLAYGQQDMLLGKVTDDIGAKKIAADSGIKVEDSKKITSGKDSPLASQIAKYINDEFRLSGNGAVNAEETNGVLKGSNFKVFERLGGAQIDKALDFNSGTSFEIISGKKDLGDGLKEAFARSIGSIVGIDRDYPLDLNGNLQRNYGTAIIESRLGLTKGRLSSMSSEEKVTFFGGNKDSWQYSDVRLGLPAGSSQAFFEGKITADQLADKAANNNIKEIAVDQIWNFFDTSGKYKVGDSDAKEIIETFSDWSAKEPADRDKAIALALKIAGRSFDQKASFAIDFVRGISDGGQDEQNTKRVIKEGVRLLFEAMGINEKFGGSQSPDKMAELLLKTYQDTSFNPAGSSGNPEIGGIPQGRLEDFISKATGIPKEFMPDIRAFIGGDYRLAINHWSGAMWTDFANRFLPEDNVLKYEDIRNSVIMDNQTLIDQEAFRLYTVAQEELGATYNLENFNLLSYDQQQEFRAQARKQLMQRFDAEARYKISDAFLNQSLYDKKIVVPKDFSKIMFTGTDKQRGELLTDFAIANLDVALTEVIPGYKAGTLQLMFDGDLTDTEKKAILLNQIYSYGAQLAGSSFNSITGLGEDFLGDFATFVVSGGKSNFYTDPKYESMWSSLDGWLTSNIGIDGLPVGISKSIYLAFNGKFDAGRSLKGANGQIIVPSLNSLGRDFLTNRVTQWADDALGMPAGTVYQLYQATVAVIRASEALSAIQAAAPALNLVGVSADQLTAAARGNLQAAQNQLVYLAITTALNACAACQEFFGSVDQALAAPPGFTNAAVAGAIANSLGMGPIGLYIAAAIYLFGVYDVDYRCPVPPNERYAYTQFDEKPDQIVYKWGSYYNDPAVTVKSNPKLGNKYLGKFDENPFDWDNSVPFSDGNDSNLWMYWSRYFTGRLLEATLAYTAGKDSRDKPNQIITFRQANVEFFGTTAAAAFGSKGKDNERVGLGFSQKSTKTTDWVHIGFGGYF
ncbi:hypothetical protein A3A71_00460 [Candidatus Berkelbacteria bacterium RIFCSPLOWO2_01_FULL_50_28]|uniref:Uncharacterized protein n=1 Tax=Candidatus Berkelbacteria bacterium RIFCSPLOWO2_01_FULL_50_28 TaxID=1797471 RepID=A0A1F5EAT5_9BACT|nr:MAG: hypothetical protein A2807_01210 [Candidatus Berkelbacteria bacterium RIFCSPHIGHO2_01_FULL_50_36]OGD64517.1 MAG: hypothetical protein A3A71_00460 [Candidatus Berkelbacteria bacterium RIFCSPLOWO2_01_FULL_50_28]